jgi:glutathione S-transferase
MPLSLPALMTLLAVLWYVVTMYQVGRARTKYKVAAPTMTGDPAFERAVRVQMNELEQLVAFLPSMWIFAWFGNPRFAAIACGVFIVGRIIYAIGYWAHARKRAVGYYIAMFALSITWVAALVSVVRWLGFA